MFKICSGLNVVCVSFYNYFIFLSNIRLVDVVIFIFIYFLFTNVVFHYCSLPFLFCGAKLKCFKPNNSRPASSQPACPTSNSPGPHATKPFASLPPRPLALHAPSSPHTPQTAWFDLCHAHQPPDPAQVKALPPRLYEIMSFTLVSLHGFAKFSKERKIEEEADN